MSRDARIEREAEKEGNPRKPVSVAMPANSVGLVVHSRHYAPLDARARPTVGSAEGKENAEVA